MNVFSRSWKITKMSFQVINQDRELIWFALLSFIFSTMFSVSMIVPSILPAIMNNGISSTSLEVYQYVLIFATYLGLAFIATFFNVCVVYTTKVRFQGGNATFGESLKFAFSKTGLIFQWSLIAATVGLLLRLLDTLGERLGKIGQIVVGILVSLLGMTWSIITIFVVPVLVYEGLGPIDAIKKSTAVIKKTWGESLIKYIGLGLISFITYVIIVILFGALSVALANQFGIVGLLFGAGIGLVILLLSVLIFGVASTIFNTALYVYATAGEVETGFDRQLMEQAFKTRKRGGIGF